MAKLPSVADMGARPTPQPGSATFGYNPGDAGGAAAGIIAQTGANIERTGEQMYEIAKVEKTKADTLRAEDAFNTLRQKQLDLTYDPEKGFANRKGANAVNAPLFQDYNKLLNNEINGIAGTLANPEQRELFLRRANVSSLEFGGNILRHVQSERQAYAKDVYNGTVATEARAAGAAWNDPNAIATSLLRTTAASEAMADQEGLPKEGPGSEARLALIQGAQSKVHASVLGQMLANNKYQDAAEYFKKNHESIDPATAKQVQNAVTDGVQKERSNAYRGAFVQTRNSMQGLQQLEAAISKDANLDDTRKTALLAQTASRIDLLQRRSDAAAERATRQWERQIDNVSAMVLKGYEPNIDQILPMVTATKGTAMEPQVRELVQLSEATRRFRLADPVQQEAMRNEVAAKVRANPTPTGVKVLNAYESIAQNQRKEVKENPVGFAYTQGLADPVQINMQNPAESAEAVQQQVGVARGVSQRYNVPLKPLQPDQVTQATAFLSTAKPKDQLQYFDSLRTATANDPQAYRAIMGQIAPDNPALALAGDYAARGRTGAATQILSGLQILRPNKKEDGTPATGKMWPMPTGKDEATMRSMFSEETSGALLIPEHRNSVEQAARAIYANKTVEAGDDKGLLDSDRWKQSIKEATGGIAKYNGTRTLLPYGTEPSEFKSGVNQRINAMAASGQLPPGVTPDRVRGLPVEAVGDGRYVFRSGDSVLVDKTGKPLVVNFNVAPAQVAPNYGNRQDGTPKGTGFYGELKGRGGSVSTEITVGVNIDGKEMEIPTLVPGLSRREINSLLSGDKPSDAIVNKAVEHAKKRMKDGKSVFIEPGEPTVSR